MFSRLKEKYQHIVIAAFLVVTAENAFAAGGGGSNKVIQFIQAIIKWLGDLSPYVITLCVLIVGYKLLWKGDTIRESAPVIIGASVIGSASFIAGLLT
ncbi:TPA: TrbC/VirB2 family protein [Pasteurella multocida]|nr:TrbC/VirB2 family protein [Pasteurella multocida]HDX1177496.1 TrbC/VirB2 family protein [Pasteurella multocida]